MKKRKTLWYTFVGIISTILTTTAQGRVEIDRIDTEGGVLTYSSQISGLEAAAKLFDGDTSTKWLANDSSTPWVQLDFAGDAKYIVDNYKITYANDEPDRAPKDWTLSGSNDGENWITISTVSGETDWELFEERSFETLDPNSVANTEAYKMYKFDVTANNGADIFQMSELTLLNGTVRLPSVPGIISAPSQINEGEGILKAIDNTKDTKWLSNNSSNDSWIMYRFMDQPYAINGYSISSCNDSHERDPKQWTLEASDDGGNWVTLDTRSGESWSEYKLRRMFEFDNTTAYYYYRINMTSNSNLTGMSEFELLDIQDDPMISSVNPEDLTTVSADSVVLSWETVRATELATYNVSVMQGNTTVYEIAGLTETEVVVPDEYITDDTIYTWQVDIVDDPAGTGAQTFAGTANKFRVLRSSEKVLEWNMDSFDNMVTYSYEWPIEDVSVSASSEESDNRKASNTINNNGLTIDPTISDPNGLQHTSNGSYTWISSPSQEDDNVWIQYDFDEPHQVGKMHIWNHNVGAPYEAELNRGMRNVIISCGPSVSDPNTWTTWGEYEIPMGTGVDGMAPSLEIDFGGELIETVRITAAAENSNWGAAGTHHALSEVRFGQYNNPVVSYSMTDASGNGNTASTYKNPSLDSEAISGSSLSMNVDGSLFLNRTTPAVETLPLGPDANCNTSWSMNFYTFMPEQAADLSFFVGFGDFEKGTGRYICKFADGIHFWGGANVDGASDVQFDVNRWQMITATYADGVLKMYKNATKIYNGAQELGLASAKVVVGGFTPWGESQINGIVDEFTLYRGPLTQEEIDALYDVMPTYALAPLPASGTVNVAIDTILTWEAPSIITDPTYNIYMGTDPEYMTLYADGIEDSLLDFADSPLAYSTTYYWYVDTIGGTPSDVWSFTTVEAGSQAEIAFGLNFESTGEIVLNYEKAITNVIATASSYEQPAVWRDPYKAVNGYGLTIDPTEPDIALAMSHSNQAPMGWCCQGGLEEKPWIKFEFDQEYELGTMHIWNHNVDPTWASETNRGMRNVIVSYSTHDSTDPNDWTVLGNYEIPEGSTDAEFIPYSIAIDFDGETAKYVKIDAAEVDSNWGDENNMHGLAEVRFGIYGTNAVTLTTPDITGKGNDAYCGGTPEFVNGIDNGTAVKFESQTNYPYDYINASITDPSVLPLAADGQWSINMYINLASNPVSPTLFGGMGGTDEASGRFVGRFGGVHFWGGDHVDAASSVQYRYGQWQMVTATYTGSTLTTYLNGEIVGTSYDITFADAAEFITIGGLNPWGNMLNATVDDFTIYSGVLTRAEIKAMSERMPIAGDLDWNGFININDLTIIADEWLSEGEAIGSDISGDTKVDLVDFVILAEKWMQN